MKTAYENISQRGCKCILMIVTLEENKEDMQTYCNRYISDHPVIFDIRVNTEEDLKQRQKSYQTFKKSDSSLLLGIQIMLPFCCHKGLWGGEKPYFTGFFTGVNLFPLDCCRGLGGDVVNNSVDAVYFVYNAP